VNTTTVGVFVGLILGLAAVLGDFTDVFVVALFGIVGFVVAKILEGDIDITNYIGQNRRR
jgi:hypothetical protein